MDENLQITGQESSIELPPKVGRVSMAVGIVIIICSSIIVFGGVLAYQQFTISKLNNIQIIEANNAPPTSKVNDWKTYSSDKYKFSIEYPQDWPVQEGGVTADGAIIAPGVVFLGNLDGDVGVLVNNIIHSTLDLDSFVERLNKFILQEDPSYKVIGIEVVSINGESAQIIDSTTEQIDPDDGKHYVYRDLDLIIKKEQEVYSMNAHVLLSKWEANKDILKQSLLSFKFTK